MEHDRRKFDYHYSFVFADGTVKEFHVYFDAKAHRIQENSKGIYPEWTKLNFFRCPHCPLDDNQQKYCPVATNIADLVTSFRGAMSFEEVDVLIETKQRDYKKHIALAKGISSLIGIFMVTSGCPVMEKLTPMVRYHLPFASVEETTYRAISMYLFAQYFLYKRGGQPDWDLKNLLKISDDVRTVNKSFCKRLANIGIPDEDASINAVVILDCFADSLHFSVSQDMLNDIETLFHAYLN